MTINGTILATFNKDGAKGYRIRNEKGEEDWYILDEKIKDFFNDKLKNKQVEFLYIERQDNKKTKKVLTFIKAEESINEIPVEKKEYFSNPLSKVGVESHSDAEKRVMAISFADRRYQSLDIALRLYKNIENFDDLINRSIEIEEYIKSGNRH